LITNIFINIIIPPTSAGTLSWEDRIFNYSSEFADPQQEFRVTILDESMNLITTVFSTNPGDPLTQTWPNSRSFDLTGILSTIAGSSVYVRFEVEAYNDCFNVYVDNISLKVVSDVCQSIVVDNDEGLCGAVVDFDIPVVAGADVTQIDETGLTSGSFFPVGYTILQYEIDYGDGEVEDTCILITVNDVEPPVIDCPEDIVVDNEPGECGTSVLYGPGSHNFTSSFAPENWTLVTNSGNGYVDLSGAPAQVTLWGSDSGSGSTIDTEYKIIIPTDGTIKFDWYYETFDGPSFDPFGYSINDVLVQVTNNSKGTIQNGSASIALNEGDEFAFVVRTTNDIFGRGSSTMFNFSFYNVEGLVNDNCPNVKVETNMEPCSFFPLGQTPVTIIATDAAGNTSECNFTVTVEDAEPPVVNCPDNMTVSNDPGMCSAVVNYIPDKIIFSEYFTQEAGKFIGLHDIWQTDHTQNI
jgi:hypothetical protein